MDKEDQREQKNSITSNQASRDINQANRDNIGTQINYNSSKEPFILHPEDLEVVIQELSLYFQKKHISIDYDKGTDFSYTKMDKKNELNKLSSDYFETIQYADKYGGEINEVLACNEECQRKYKYTALIIKQYILVIKDKIGLNNFDDILYHLYSEIKPKLVDKLGLENDLVLLCLHHMYLSCDIGKKE